MNAHNIICTRICEWSQEHSARWGERLAFYSHISAGCTSSNLETWLQFGHNCVTLYHKHYPLALALQQSHKTTIQRNEITEWEKYKALKRREDNVVYTDKKNKWKKKSKTGQDIIHKSTQKKSICSHKNQKCSNGKFWKRCPYVWMK